MSNKSHEDLESSKERGRTNQAAMSMAPPQGSSLGGGYGGHQQQPVVVSSYSYHAQPMKPTAVLAGKPTLIQWDRLRFLIMDAPRVS